MDPDKYYQILEKKLTDGIYLCTKRNNLLLKEFIKAKINGAYERLIFEKRINSSETSIKKCMNIKKFDEYFKKDFDKITEDEILKFRDLMNNDKVLKAKTLIKRKDGKPCFEVVQTKNPLSYRTKIDYRSNFGEFWKFIIEYDYQEQLKTKKAEEIKELPNIMRYFKLQKPEDYQEVIVEFIPDDDLITLLSNIRNRNFKSYIELSIMSGARPCEAIKIKYGKKYNLYQNKDGKWIIHLPKIKGVSHHKYPVEIDMYEDELIPYFKSLNLKDGDYVFKLTPQTVRRLMKHYTEKYLKHHYSPKILRKTTRMIRTNAKYSEQWINKLMGHSPNSRVLSHYIDHGGIKSEPLANEKLKAQQYPSLKKDYANLQLKMKAQDEKMLEMQQKMDEKEAKIIEQIYKKLKQKE